MVIENTGVEVTQPGNDVATVFSVSPMVVAGADEIDVYLVTAAGARTLLTRGVHYSVNITGFPGTGSISYPLSGVPLATGDFLNIVRNTNVLQPTDLVNQGGFFPEVIEDEFDRSRMIDQELDARLTSVEGTLSGLDTVAGTAAEDADQINYDNAVSGLTATNVQDAIDELDADLDAIPSLLANKADKSTVITASSPLTGGGSLAANVTIGHGTSGVTPGSYVNPSITVDDKGHVTGVSSGTSPVPSSRVVNAGTGLTGGGSLVTDITLNLADTAVTPGAYAAANITVDQQGRITAAANGSGGTSAFWKNVKDFGATGDGTTDDAAAIAAAVADIPSTGGVLFFPSGVYRCTTAISITDKSVHVMGSGVEVSKIKFDGAPDGILFLDTSGASGNDRATFSVSNILLTTTVAGGGKAISADFTGSGGVLASIESLRVYNVGMRGDDAYVGSPSAFWTYGIYMDDCSSVFISNLHCIAGTGNDSGTAGIYITRSAADNAQNFRISNVYIERMGVGIHAEHVGSASQSVEGIYITNGELVGNNIGVKLRATGGGSVGTTMIRGLHINARTHAVQGDVNASGVLITGCEMRLQNNGGSFVSPADVVKISGGQGAIIVGNYIIGFASGGNSHNGVTITGNTLSSTVTGNLISDVTNGVFLSSNSGGTINVEGNNFINAANQIYDDKAAGGQIINRFRGALVGNSADIAYTGTYIVSWNSEQYDTDDFWASGSPTRLTIPANKGIRRVRLTGSVFSFSGSGSIEARYQIKKNGSGGYIGRANGDSHTPTLDHRCTFQTAIITVNDGDYFEVETFGASGGTLGADRCWFSIEVIN